MIKIESTLDKVELRKSEENEDITEVWTKEDIQCFASMRNNYNTGLSIICEDDDLVFMNMAYVTDDPIYIEDDRFCKCRNNKSIKIDIINYGCRLYTIPKSTKILELTCTTKYNTNIKKYNNSILNIGNVLVVSSLKNQVCEKFESSTNSNGTENLIITLKQPIVMNS